MAEYIGLPNFLDIQSKMRDIPNVFGQRMAGGMQSLSGGLKNLGQAKSEEDRKAKEDQLHELIGTEWDKQGGMFDGMTTGQKWRKLGMGSLPAEGGTGLVCIFVPPVATKNLRI